MKIIQNIKYQYQLKTIEENLKSSNHLEIRNSLLRYSKSNPLEFLNLLKYFMPKFLNITSDENIFFNNILFVNSFNLADCNIITNFLNYYLGKTEKNDYQISNYQEELINTLRLINKDGFIDENDLFQNTIYYQTLFTFLYSDVISILSNQSAFFSTPQNLNFTNPRIVRCYFLLVEHPYITFNKYKSTSGSKDIAMNEFLNLDDKPLFAEQGQLKMAITRKDWGTFNNSWLDPNVLNTLRGIVLKKEDYYENPEEFFTSVILHLKQSGYNIPINYNFISEYIKNLKLETPSIEDGKVSNKEKKLLKKIESTADKLKYIF